MTNFVFEHIPKEESRTPIRGRGDSSFSGYAITSTPSQANVTLVSNALWTIGMALIGGAVGRALYATRDNNES